MQGLKDIVQLTKGSEHEKRVTIVGTLGSGKTTVVGCLYITCQALSQEQKNFYYDVKEISIPIRDFPSRLRMGHFPPKTPPGPLYESDFVLRWDDVWGKKNLHLPTCETSGEAIERLIRKFEKDSYKMVTEGWHDAEIIAKHVCDSSGYLVVVPAPRITVENTQLEPEPDDLSVDPDTNVARILSAIFDYKARSKSKQIEGIGVLITKCDRIFTWAKNKGFNLSTPEGKQVFMNRYFPDTMGKLKMFGLDKVRFFSVFVEVEKDSNNQPLKWGDGKERIVVNEETRMPSFPTGEYLEMIMWLKQTFTK